MNEPLADENWLAQYEAERKKEQELKRNFALNMPFSLFGLSLHPKTTHLSGISFLSTEAKIVILLLARVLKKRAISNL